MSIHELPVIQEPARKNPPATTRFKVSFAIYSAFYCALIFSIAHYGSQFEARERTEAVASPQPKSEATRVVPVVATESAASRLYAQRVALQNHPFLVCVRAHESATAGAYEAQNPVSTASGAYQFLDATWKVASVQAGFYGLPTAKSAEWWVQDAVAYDLAIRRGQKSHWNGTGCF
jgi:hypothetical protein